MNEQRFRYLWKAIWRVWREQGHCLRLGCGRETFWFWVWTTSNAVLARPAELRSALMEGVRRGWCVKKQSPTGHSIFLMR